MDAETDSEQTSESQDDTATKHKTGQKSKKEEEEESSDDEELVGRRENYKKISSM